MGSASIFGGIFIMTMWLLLSNLPGMNPTTAIIGTIFGATLALIGAIQGRNQQ